MITPASPQPGNRDEMPSCRCGHAFVRHLGYVGYRSDPCAGGTPGFCGCPGYTPAAAAADQSTGGCQGRESCEITCCMDEPTGGEADGHTHVDEYDGIVDCSCPVPSAGQDTERLRDELLAILVRHISVGPVRTSALRDLLDGPLRRLIAERDEARATVQRVRAEIDSSDSGVMVYVEALRRALDEP